MDEVERFGNVKTSDENVGNQVGVG